MLTYGRNAKKTFCVFMSQERHKPFFGHVNFHHGSLSIKFCCCEFLVNVFKKGLFLTSTNPTLPIFKGGNCSVVGS